MINKENSLILIIDMQEKLVNMVGKDTISDKAAKLLRAARILDIPVIITEQYPTGLGSTLQELKQEMSEKTVIFEKTAFSVMQELDFKGILDSYSRDNILVCGIEAHICVYQTVADLINEGYEVEIFKDITASRKEFEFNIGIERMKQVGAQITSFEIVLFEFLKTSKHPHFKDIQALIKTV